MVMQTIDIEPDIVQAMDDMPYGCYIVGSHDCAGIPNGMMADWLMQVAFTPRMVAVSFENDAHTLANIRATGTFTVNMLPRDDSGMHLAARFAQPYDGAKVAGRSHNGDTTIHHKLEGLAFHDASDGSPVLDGACAWSNARPTPTKASATTPSSPLASSMAACTATSTSLPRS